jgi:penicillin-binding protein 1A
VQDLFSNKPKKERLINWLGIDAWIDSRLAEVLYQFQERWSASTSYFARFRLTGWKRGSNEILSETLTMGLAGLCFIYALAIPAFIEFDESKITQGKYAVKFLDRNGNEIGKRGILHDDAVSLEDLPDHLIKATMATEDRRFFDHFGVDFIGTARAFVANAQAGETVQGGSTLTQQLAKNLFLSSERSVVRKLKEVFLSFLLESRYTKREILKMYLDRAYMGGGAFGVEAAAQFYFGKSVREVTLAEAAMMAGLFKAPTKYAPHVNLPAARGRANEVLSNLVEAGYMTAGQVHAARLNPARAIETRSTTSPDWYLDWAFEEIQRVAEGKGVYSITARTTVDMTMQAAAEEALLSTIKNEGRKQNAKSGALVSMDPDGAVRAIVGGIDYGESQFNRATRAKRQPGSSVKLYVYAAALENGYTSKSVLRDSPVSCGNWSPKNYDGSTGSGRSVDIGYAFKQSLNTTAVDLSLKVGRDKVVEFAQRLGVDGVKKTCSMALGDGSTSVIEHTGAYAHFANGGKTARPYAILEMYNGKGELFYSRQRDEPEAQQVIKPRVVEQMNQLMSLVVTDGTGKRAALDFTNVVGKTGTSSSYKDAWFVGFTGGLVTGVWFGNDDNRAMNKITGGSLPAQTWQNFMSVAQTNMNIPTILGLSQHPRQAQELQRLAELRKTEPAATAAQASNTLRKNGIMPDQTRDLLKKIAETLRKVGGLAEPAGTPGPGTAPERRADTSPRGSMQPLFGAGGAISPAAPPQ